MPSHLCWYLEVLDFLVIRAVLLSLIGWMALMVLSRKLRCAAGSPNAVSRIVQATSTEVIPSGGTRFAASPMRAFLSFPSWSDFDTLLSVTAVSKSSLKTMKSSLGVPPKVGSSAGQGLAILSEYRPCFMFASSMFLILTGIVFCRLRRLPSSVLMSMSAMPWVFIRALRLVRSLVICAAYFLYGFLDFIPSVMMWSSAVR